MALTNLSFFCNEECKIDRHIYPDELLRGNEQENDSIIVQSFESTQCGRVHVPMIKLGGTHAHIRSRNGYTAQESDSRTQSWTGALVIDSARFDDLHGGHSTYSRYSVVFTSDAFKRLGQY